MKEIYENPTMDIIEFGNEDILTTSTVSDFDQVSQDLATAGKANVLHGSWVSLQIVE